jgi:hypothetical protein
MYNSDQAKVDLVIKCNGAVQNRIDLINGSALPEMWRKVEELHK